MKMRLDKLLVERELVSTRERGRALERKNARYLMAEDVGEAVGLVAMDVSFISATLVLPAVVESIQQAQAQLGPDTRCAEPARLEAVVLVKPQFEVGRAQVG